MTDLRLRLLGPPEVQVDGAPLQVDTRKAVAVLALLVVDGDETRASLARMLWPDSDPSRAKAALRRTLSVLNRGLGDRWLVTDRDQVRLQGPLDVDVWRLDGAIEAAAAHDHADGRCDPCRAALAEVVPLHRGELLEGFVLRDSPEFEDWRVAREEHLRRRLCQGLDLLGRLHVAAAELEAATEACRRWSRVDPLNELVYRRLMLLHAWSGQRGHAIESYRSCVAVLDRELGVTPVARTTDLYRAVLEDRLPPRPGRTEDTVFHAPVSASVATAADADAEVSASDLPLVGRDEVLAQLLHEHGQPGGHLLVVTGEAGVGKTRLADEFADRVRAAGGRVATARCHPGEVELAYGAVVDLLQQAIGRVPLSRLDDIDPWCLAEAARLVPDLVGPGRELPAVVPLSSPGARARLFDAVWQVLELALTFDTRGALVIDDLHAIDAASLDLVGYGLRRLADRELTLIACVRPEDLGDDHPARNWLLDRSTTDVGACEVVLDRLADVEVDRLVAAAFDPVDVPGLAAQIRTESEGLPLLVVEYLRLLQDRDHDDPAGQDLRELVPHGAAELARQRLAQVSETARQIASTAATVGRSFDLSVVLQASGRTEDEVVDGLEELQARQIVRELPSDQQTSAGDVRYDFVHHKLRQAIYERTSLARRRLLHGRVAEALAAGTRGGRDAGALAALVAEHHRRGGHDHEAAAWFRLAGDHARSLFAVREALDHYLRALALHDAGDGDLHGRIAEARMLLGDYADAFEALELAAAGAEDDLSLARIEHQLGVLHLRLGDDVAAAARLGRAAALGADDDALLARVHADRALAAVRAGDLGAATSAADTAHAHGAAADDAEAVAQVRNVQGLVARHRGDHTRAQEHFTASMEHAGALPDPAAAIAAMNNLALTEADLGDLDTAIDRAREAVALVVRRGDRHREAALRNNLADLLHRAGREDEAMAALKDAVVIFADIGQDRHRLRPEIWKLVEW